MDSLRHTRFFMTALAPTFLGIMGLMGALGALAPAASAQTWPMNNGSHDILHSFQNPFYFSSYFHEGVDIRGDLDQVVAMRAGTVRYVNQGDAGGNLVVEVDTGGVIEADSYLHVLLDPWNPGDPINAGDVIGVVSNTYFGQLNQHHVHVNRFDGYAGGNGYVFNRTNMLHPLQMFSNPADRDPQVLAAGPFDSNEDSAIFEIVLASDNSVVRPFPFGRVDLLLEASDRQTSSLYWNQGLMGVGYWIEARSGGADVRSAAQPYRLVRFDDDWRSSHGSPDSLVTTALVSNFGHTVQFGPDNTQWTSLATYKLTNTTGTAGSGGDLDAAQSWRTGGKIGTATEPNGNDGVGAQEIHEALFPDGVYVVHALTEDLNQEIDTEYPVVVDNFRPYVESVSASIGGSEFYRGEWTYDDVGMFLDFSVTSPRPRIGGTPAIELEILFSEPMGSAEIQSTQPDIGFLPALSSDEPHDNQRTWKGVFPARTLRGSRKGDTLRLLISASDLNGSSLHDFGGTSQVAVPFNKRTSAAALDDSTTDSIHVMVFPEFGDVHLPLLDGGSR